MKIIILFYFKKKYFNIYHLKEDYKNMVKIFRIMYSNLNLAVVQ